MSGIGRPPKKIEAQVYQQMRTARRERLGKLRRYRQSLM